MRFNSFVNLKKFQFNSNNSRFISRKFLLYLKDNSITIYDDKEI